MKWWDIQRPRTAMRLRWERYIVNKFFRTLETRGGMVGDKAVLFIYNEQSPELSYIILEEI